jgi:hypothetical protein
MTKRIFMLTTVTLALVCGGIPARAQEDSDDEGGEVLAFG